MSTLKTDNIESLDTGRVIEVDSLSDRQDLANDASGKGASLVSMEGGPTVEVAVLDRVIRVTSIAAMEAYSAPVGYVFNLNAGGRSGVFDVIAGDFSTELAADTENGIYIGLADDPTGASKVAKRRIEGMLSVKVFGATGDGVTDDTAKLQAAFDSEARNNLFVLDGTYMIDALTGVFIKSDSFIQWSKNAVFKAITNSAGNYAILNIRGVSNITLIEPVVKGERSTHIGLTGEWGMGFYITNVSDISLIRPKATDCWGDGFYISGVDNCYMEYPVCDNNRRQGISVISAENFLINGGRLDNTNGANPQAGIDFEPNNNTQKLVNCVVNNIRCSGNAGPGITIVPFGLDSTSKDVSITINNPVIDGNDEGVYIVPTADVKGSIVINDLISKSSRLSGVRIDSNANGIKTIIKKPIIENANGNGSTSDLHGAAITIGSRPGEPTSTYPIGNVEIYNPTIKSDSGSSNTSGFYIVDQRGIGIGIRNVKIIDPLEITGSGDKLVFSDGYMENTDTVVVTDKSGVLDQAPTGSTTLSERNYTTRLSSKNLIGSANLELENAFPIGAKVKFDALNSNRTLIIENSEIYPRFPNYTTKIIAETYGSTITLEKITSDSWQVVNTAGEWSTL